MASIESEFTLPSGLVLKNRLVKASTTEGLANAYGQSTPELTRLYKTWAEDSDVGLIMSGNVQVDRRFLERPGNVCIDLDYKELVQEQMDALKELAAAGKANGAKFFIQIGHAGRQSNPLVCDKAPGPSAIATKAGFGTAKEVFEMTLEDIERVTEKIIYASKICKEAGFDGVLIHSAHGYLLSSFLNPLANQRTDDYGGSVQNRAKFLINALRGVREATGPEFSLAVKLNSSDFQKGGFTVEECAEVALMLAAEKIDLLELSGGNYESPALLTGETNDAGAKEEPKLESTRKREAFFLQFADQIVKDLKNAGHALPLMVTGGFRSKSVMNEALESASTDLIGIARPLCVDPGSTKRLLAGEINVLPTVEQAWRLPWFLGFSSLLRFKFFATLAFAATQFTMYQNLIDIGHGSFKPQSNTKYPNILRRLIKRNKGETATAKGLKGYKKDDPYIKEFLKR